MTQYNAVDLSFSPISDQILQDPAIRLVIQCLWTGEEAPAPRVSNLYKAAAAGKLIAGYVSLTPSGGGGYWHVAQSMIGIPPELIRLFTFRAIDVEVRGLAGDQIDHALDAAGARRIIYTRRSFWQGEPYAGRDFNALLWDARDGSFMPYGPWAIEAQCIGVQFAWDRDMGGASVDLDAFVLENGGNVPTDPTDDQKNIASLEARQKMAAAALNNDMHYLVTLLSAFGVIPQGTPVQKPNV